MNAPAEMPDTVTPVSATLTGGMSAPGTIVDEVAEAAAAAAAAASAEAKRMRKRVTLFWSESKAPRVLGRGRRRRRPRLAHQSRVKMGGHGHSASPAPAVAGEVSAYLFNAAGLAASCSQRPCQARRLSPPARRPSEHCRRARSRCLSHPLQEGALPLHFQLAYYMLHSCVFSAGSQRLQRVRRRARR